MDNKSNNKGCLVKVALFLAIVMFVLFVSCIDSNISVKPTKEDVPIDFVTELEDGSDRWTLHEVDMDVLDSAVYTKYFILVDNLTGNQYMCIVYGTSISICPVLD